MYERRRLISMLLDPYFAFIRMVAGRANVAVDTVICDAHKRNAAFNMQLALFVDSGLVQNGSSGAA